MILYPYIAVLYWKKKWLLCVLPSKQNISSVSLFPRDMDRAQKSGSLRKKKRKGPLSTETPLSTFFFLYNNKMYIWKKRGGSGITENTFSSVIFSSDRYKKKFVWPPKTFFFIFSPSGRRRENRQLPIIWLFKNRLNFLFLTGSMVFLKKTADVSHLEPAA